MHPVAAAWLYSVAILAIAVPGGASAATGSAPPTDRVAGTRSGTLELSRRRRDRGESCPRSSKGISRERCSGARTSVGPGSETSTSPGSRSATRGSSASTSMRWSRGSSINGVDVTAYVNERDPWYPLRAMLRPPTPAGMRAAWAALEGEWGTTIALAAALPESAVYESVNGEWSFVQTLRHLVFAMDNGSRPRPRRPLRPDAGCRTQGSVDFPWPGLDGDADTVARGRLGGGRDRAARFRDYLESVAWRSRTSGRRARERHQPGARSAS